jgi:2-isopropylmalate synthase
VTEGIDALGEVTVRVQALSGLETQNAQHEAKAALVFHGNAADTDIIVASANAYLKALNRMLVSLGHSRPTAAERTTPPPQPPASLAEESRP